MNRASRRKLAKNGVTPQSLRKLETQAGADATERAVRSYSIAVATVLKEKLQYKSPKILLTMRQIQQEFEKVNHDTRTIYEMEKMLEEELGLTFTGSGEIAEEAI